VTSHETVLLETALASDFIAKHELPPLLDAAKRDGLKIIWILVSDCLFQETPIMQYQAAHDISRPLDLLAKPRRIAVLTNICKTIVTYAR
jgi:internalin A